MKPRIKKNLLEPKKLPFGLRLAKEGSKRSNCTMKIGAALVNHEKILISWNTLVSSPAILYHGYRFPNQNHAEFGLFSFTHNREIVKVKGKIFVYREFADGQPALARPCYNCRDFLKNVMGIKTVVYTTDFGWTKEKL
jgi:hypothetical protein